MSEPTTEVEAVALNLKERLGIFDLYAGFGKTQHYGPQQAETDRRVLKILAAMSPALEARARLQAEEIISARLWNEKQLLLIDVVNERARAEAAEARVKALEGALTPSTETKAAYIGEFQFQFGEYTPNVPWTCVKQIMAAIRARAALAVQGVERG